MFVVFVRELKVTRVMQERQEIPVTLATGVLPVRTVQLETQVPRDPLVDQVYLD